MKRKLPNGVKLLFAKLLLERLNYDHNTGIFTWKVPPKNKAWCNGRAGRIDTYGYRQIQFGDRLFFAHHLAWVLLHGEWPEPEIDHRNGNPDDNWADNLRLSDRSRQVQNAGRRSDNLSGVTGVTYAADRGKWRAFISVDKKVKYLGSFATKEEAIAARHAGASEHYGEFARAA